MSTEEHRPILPEAVQGASPENAPSATSGLKRKAVAHDDEGDSPKRSRREDVSARPPSPRSHCEKITSGNGENLRNDEATRRKSATHEDKSRGRRLFGGLLTTLSQTPSDQRLKQRQEIEKRQKERLQKQKYDDDEKRQQRLLYLDKVRTEQQARFDERVMEKRHSKMLWMGNYLRTKSRPHIYYRPYRPTKGQERAIEEQVRDAKAIIERERGGQKGRGAMGQTTQQDERLRASSAERDAATPHNDKEEEVAADEDDGSASAGKIERDHDDEVLEAGEDTLIY